MDGQTMVSLESMMWDSIVSPQCSTLVRQQLQEAELLGISTRLSEEWYTNPQSFWSNSSSSSNHQGQLQSNYGC
eukprot:1873043-Amphidinium_carterae.1